MNETLQLSRDATITVEDDEARTTASIYSPEGVDLLNTVRLKQAAEFKVMYEPSWLGIRMIQLPEDIVSMQELLWSVKPDVVLEFGVAHGGSLIFHASILELIGSGSVIGVDVDIRPHNRRAIESHPLSKRIQLIEGSSISESIRERVTLECQGRSPILVILDSNHSRDHVSREIDLYSPLVTVGSYLVVMDGAQALVSDIPRGDPSWRNDNPLASIDAFLSSTSDFQIDPHYERFGVTCCPRGFLRRVAPHRPERQNA